jgi:GNAT superfamily N-acetyltransferase
MGLIMSNNYFQIDEMKDGDLPAVRILAEQLGYPADIGALVVDTKVRNQGIGASLMTTAEKWATDRNLKLMRVRSNMKRTDAHRFYQRQGYEIVKSWHLFTKALKDSEQ